jgi:hypothetical protein
MDAWVDWQTAAFGFADAKAEGSFLSSSNYDVTSEPTKQ